MNRRHVLTALVLLAIAVLISIGMTTSYLTDVDVKDNVITIGKVSIALDEGPVFVPPTDPEDPPVLVDVVPGSVTEKSPMLTNDGSKDEFVFLMITVPKADVTLLYEADDGENKKGTPRAEKRPQEIFRFLADDTTLAVATASGLSEIDVDFRYHCAEDESEGWVLLERDESDDEMDRYLFGYNKKLAPTEQTVTLFDTVQLKSFIDGEASGETEIGVFCYGIQAEHLKVDEAIELDQPYLDAEALEAIWTIVGNKIAAVTEP